MRAQVREPVWVGQCWGVSCSPSLKKSQHLPVNTHGVQMRGADIVSSSHTVSLNQTSRAASPFVFNPSSLSLPHPCLGSLFVVGSHSSGDMFPEKMRRRQLVNSPPFRGEHGLLDFHSGAPAGDTRPSWEMGPLQSTALMCYSGKAPFPPRVRPGRKEGVRETRSPVLPH